MAYCRSLRRARSRREAQAFIVEGLRLAHDAFEAGATPTLILFNRSTLVSTALGRSLLDRIEHLENVFEVSPAVIEAAADTQSPAGLVMVVAEPDRFPPEAASSTDLLLILDGLADAGNAGTILRSAAAAGLRTVVFAGNTVDPYGAKTVRSGMGAHFRIRVLRASWAELASSLTTYEQVLGMSAGAGKTVYDIDWHPSTALIIGSEAHGLSQRALSVVTGIAHIPMSQGVESLNAASVAAITLFEAKRNREFGVPIVL